MHRIIFLYYLILGLALLTNFVTMRLRKLPVGRAWEALREDEIACRSLGINTTNTKLTAFAIGADVRRFCRFVLRGPPGLRLSGELQLPRIRRSSSPSWCSAAWARRSASPSRAVVLVGGPEVLRNLGFLQAIFGEGFDPNEYRLLLFGARHGRDDGVASARPDFGARTVGDLEGAQGHLGLAREGRARLMRWLQDPVLDVQHLTMRFGGLVAVNDLSFSAGRGDITALIGPNGAGKTTVFNCITGFYKPTEGMMTLRKPGRLAFCSSSGCPGYSINWKAKVARTFQNIRLFSGMTVLENLLVAQHNSLMIASGFTFLGVLGLGGYRAAESEAIERAKYWLEKDAPHRPRRRPGGRSSLWRPAPARNRPRHVHRPAAALPRRAGGGPQSARSRSSSTSSCCRSARITRTSILLIEHDMSVVMEISDHVVVLDYGIKISDGTPVGGEARSARHRRLSRRRRRRGREGRSGDRRMSIAGTNVRG